MNGGLYRFELGQERLQATLDGPNIQADRKHLAAEIDAAFGVGEIARQDCPVNALGRGGLGDALDRLPYLRIVPIADDAHRLAQIGGPDEENIHILESGDFLDVFDGADMFDL